MVICGPQPQKTVPLIASQISDRDNAVRSAALNAMVVVYGNVGDAVFKFTSKVSKTYMYSAYYDASVCTLLIFSCDTDDELILGAKYNSA